MTNVLVNSASSTPSGTNVTVAVETSSNPFSQNSGAQFDQPSLDFLEHLLARQRAAYQLDTVPTAKLRKERLQKLHDAIIKHQDALCEAMAADFGSRSRVESKIGDLLSTILNVKHAISHVARWMRPQKRATELLFAVNACWVEYQPKGVVGIIAPWNFPIYLAIGPLVAALAAGNRAMIKMSEFTPLTTKALRTALAEAFCEDEVCVLGGDVEVGRNFSGLKFDHIIFTGSTNVGRNVMAAAAQNLTPVTLELGGKSPAIVSRSESMSVAAAKIAHGKSFNCGQICVSPDYAIVPREKLDDFVTAIRAEFKKMHPKGCQSDADGYTNVVTPAHAQRIIRLIDDARQKGAKVIPCEGDLKGQRIPLQIVLNPTEDMTVMREEIFGPILPVLTYDKIDDAIAYVIKHDRPLALYWFGRDSVECRRIMQETHSGGVVINDWGWHVFQNDLPFGGVGSSGMGSYHGIEGFVALSHPKSVFKERRWFPVKLFYPPYSNFAHNLTLRLYLGAQKSRR